MKRVLFLFVAVMVIVISGVVGFLYITRSRSVVMRIAPDGNMRPRYYCIMNPFRDRGPETIASGHLRQLQSGNVQAISCCVGNRKEIIGKEKEYPIQSWRIGGRTDEIGKTDVIYWVKRGNGYSRDGHEELVHFTLTSAGSDWKLQSFSAIY